MRGKRLRERLGAGRPVFMATVWFYAPRLVELLARSGVDQLFVDAEHGALSERDCEEMVRAADVYDLPVMIRPPANEPHVILRYLDIGTSSLLVPHVGSREAAERAVRAAKYPPQGRRSFAPGRGAELFNLDPGAYARRANEETLVIGLFEDVAGLDEVEAICEVEGIDGLYVGPFDLAASMGFTGDPFRAEVQAVVERVRQVCRGRGMPFGTVARDRADLRAQVAAGDRLILLDSIGWGIAATREAVDELGGVEAGGE